MKLLQILFTFSLLIVAIQYSNAQQNHTLSNLTKLAQSHYENPANHANGKVYIGIGLSQHSIGLNNNGFVLSKVLKNRPQDDSLVVDKQALFNSLKPTNNFLLDVRNEILGIGFNVKKNYFSFSVTNRIIGNIVYPKDLIVLGFEGNGRSLLGERASLDGLGANITGYMEYALGYNREINDKLRIGGRIKAFSGYANLTTRKSNLGITTDENTYDIHIDGEFGFNSSGFGAILDNDSTTQFKFDPASLYNFKNLGFGIDLGVNYKITEKIELNASVLDLGFIRWNTETGNFKTDNFNFGFNGVDLNRYLSGDSTNYFNELKDSILGQINGNMYTGSYTSNLSARFYLGARYHVTDWFTLSISSFNQVITNKIRMSGMVAGTIQLKNWLGFTVNYSNYGRSWGNIGVGLSLRGGPIQFYVATDNILGLNYFGTKNIHVNFGLNLLIGKLKKTETKTLVDF